MVTEVCQRFGLHQSDQLTRSDCNHFNKLVRYGTTHMEDMNDMDQYE